jgi:enoyl-CoA hydratase/carnithine racemase
MPEPSVLYEKRDGVGWVTLNRPAVLNALNLEMRDQLWETFLAVRDDPEVAVAVIQGAGSRAFSAGADVTEFGTAPSFMAARAARRERDLWALLLNLEKPLIAAIHGFAYGAGCEMSLCCDIRLAADDARFALPEVALAYIPSAGGTQLLPRSIRPGLAMEMILTGEPIGAEQALQLGLVHKVIPVANLHEAANATATSLLRRPAPALRYAKRALAAAFETPLVVGLAIEARLALRALIARPAPDSG